MNATLPKAGHTLCLWLCEECGLGTTIVPVICPRCGESKALRWVNVELTTDPRRVGK